MYMVMIFNEYECQKLNSVCFFDTIKDIITWSNGLLKYNDVSKLDRIYKTYKCFFKIVEVHKLDEQYYFPKFKKLNRKL
jgi:hypothetical protein